MTNLGLTNDEIKQLLLAVSDEEVVSEIDDHVSESELSSDDDADDESAQSTSQTATLLRKDGKIE